jgi:four helix bundle protein
MKIEKFEDIKAWILAKELAVEIYKIECKTTYGVDLSFKDQIQRAVISIMSNIAEGFERGSDKDFIKYLYISKGSCGEVRSLLNIAKEIGYIDSESFRILNSKCEEISKAISGFIKYLSKDRL